MGRGPRLIANTSCRIATGRAALDRASVHRFLRPVGGGVDHLRSTATAAAGCQARTAPPRPRRPAPCAAPCSVAWPLAESSLLLGKSSRSSAQSRCLSTPVQITEDRLQEFLQAEVAFFANQEASSISLKQVLDAGTPEKAAILSHNELPIRFAQRILQIEGVTGWRSIPELVEVHNVYSNTFREMRLCELDVDNLEPFTDNINRLKGRMKVVIPKLASAFQSLKASQVMNEDTIQNWLDNFLLSRIGTEMLTSQYIACAKPPVPGPKVKRKHGGIVDDACDPASICEQAGKHAVKLAKQHFASDKVVRIIVEADEKRVKFPYVPQYLFYIMLELLKNSARATVEAANYDPKQIEARPITITVGADENQVAIRVHDLAGGIPFSVGEKVFSYMFSTAPQFSGSSSVKNFSQQGTPLAGYGVGLPLSRLYARYLGGKLELMSLPGVGTSAYLYLKRLENEAREELPPGSSVGDGDLYSF